MRIFGVDPGSRLTGYGCVECQSNRMRPVGHGTLRLPTRSTQNWEDRLVTLFESLTQLITEYQPGVLVVERIFFAKNPLSALKLGQVRGVILLAGKLQALTIAEYTPTEVKSALVGYGHADKAQVAFMVQQLLGRSQFQTDDASDSLALAICHARMSGIL